MSAKIGEDDLVTTTKMNTSTFLVTLAIHLNDNSIPCYLQCCNRWTSVLHNHYVRKKETEIKKKKGELRCPYIRLLDFTQGAGHRLVFDR